MGNVTEPSLVRSYFWVIRLFTSLSFVLFPFSCTRSSSFLPRCSPSSSRFHGSSPPRLQSSTNGIRFHGPSPPWFPSSPRTSPQLPALHSLRGIYTPASSLRVPRLLVSLQRSSGTLDRASSVISSFFHCLIKRLRAKLALCVGSVILGQSCDP